MRWFVLVPVLLVLAGCADEIPEDVSAQMDAREAASRPAGPDTAPAADRMEALLEAAPPGTYRDWIAALEAGLDSVMADVAEDRGEALHSVQELYRRQYTSLADFYGPQGAAPEATILGQAVEQVGSQMLELMRRIADDQADTARITETVTATKQALRVLGTQAAAAGLSPDAPRLPPADSL